MPFAASRGTQVSGAYRPGGALCATPGRRGLQPRARQL